MCNFTQDWWLVMTVHTIYNVNFHCTIYLELLMCTYCGMHNVYDWFGGEYRIIIVCWTGICYVVGCIIYFKNCLLHTCSFVQLKNCDACEDRLQLYIQLVKIEMHLWRKIKMSASQCEGLFVLPCLAGYCYWCYYSKNCYGLQNCRPRIFAISV